MVTTFVAVAALPVAAALATRYGVVHHRAGERVLGRADSRLRDGLASDPLGPLAVIGDEPLHAVEPYVEPAPTVSAVSPNEGSTEGGSTLNIVPGRGGGQTVTITGTGFEEATRVAFGRWPAVAFRTSETHIVAVPPAHEPGVVDVTVSNKGGTSATSSADRYTYGPVVESVTPREGPNEGGTPITIKGRGFEGAKAVGFAAIGRPCSKSALPAEAASIAQPSVNEVEAITPTPEGLCKTVNETASGSADVTVTGSLGRSAPSPTDRFNFGPGVEEVEPQEGPTGGGTMVTIRGHGFRSSIAEDEVTFGAPLATEVKYVSSEELEAKSPAHAPGTVAVRVTTPDGAGSTTESSRYSFGPTVTSVEPHAGNLAGGASVKIKGHGFVSNPSEDEIKFGEAKATGVTFRSATELEASAPAAPEGKAQALAVTVTTSGGKSAETKSDLYAYGLPFVEKLEAVEPFEPLEATGAVGEEGALVIGHSSGKRIKVVGRNFTAVKEVAFQTNNGSVASPRFEVNAEGTQIVATSPLVEQASGEASEQAHLRVQTAVGVSPDTSLDLIQFAAGPQVTKVEAHEGSSTGGATVRILGWNFVPGATEVRFGGVPASHTVTKAYAVGFPNPTETEIIATAPAHAPGVVDVTVTTLEGTSNVSAADRFTYHAFGIQPGSFEVTACGEEEAGQTLAACGYFGPEDGFFTQAAGAPPFLAIGLGITASEADLAHPGFDTQPTGVLKDLRLDLPPGLNFNPQALPRCSLASVPSHLAVECPKDTVVGVVDIEALIGGGASAARAQVVNVEPPAGAPFEIAFTVPAFGRNTLIVGRLSTQREPQVEAEGVPTGDYHGIAIAEEVPDQTTPVISERLVFDGNAAQDGFITLPSECQKTLTYHASVGSYGEKEEEALGYLPHGVVPEFGTASTTAPVGTTGCKNVPFKPEVHVTPETSAADESDGASVEIAVPQGTNPNTADPRQITVALPEGMTFTPSVANGLAACSNEQLGVARNASGEFEERPLVVEEHEVECPASSKIGTFVVESPDLPAEVCAEEELTPLKECEEAHLPTKKTLEGSVYLASPLSGEPRSGDEYRLFLTADSKRYGVHVRLLGNVSVDPVTGRVSTTVETPQLPFSRSVLKLRGGSAAPLANPLVCGSATAEGLLTPYGEEAGGKLLPEPRAVNSAFAVTGCSSPPPFSLSQSTEDQPSLAGESPTFTLNLVREDGQQYLTGVRTTLPEGLTGSIAAVPVLCGEAQANGGDCPAESAIGTVTTRAGVGPEPLVLAGQVYLTGPYDGAPYGLAIAVPAEHIGPYDYGKIITRAKLEIDPYTTRVTTTASLPTIVGGVPIRLRSIQIRLTRPGFMRNPTNCSPLATETLLTGTSTLPPTATGAQSLATPFAATGCASLAFRPSFSAATNAKTSPVDGASLEVLLNPRLHDANLKELHITLPKQLPSRLSTLQKACTEAQANANITGCPTASKVANATLVTPLLPGSLSGPGFLVSHGGRAFPDLDFVLEGDGIRLIEVGHTEIKQGITSSTFGALPDAPFTSFKATFPSGPGSLFGANGSFCSVTATNTKREVERAHGHVVRKHGRVQYKRVKVRRKVPVSLTLPIEMTGENGLKVSQAVKVAVAGCAPSAPLAIGAHVLRGNKVLLTLKTSQKGAVTVSGRDVKRIRRALAAGTHKLQVPLSKAGRKLKRSHARIRIRIALKVGRHTSVKTVLMRL